jgi:hypothetical protein
MLVKPDVCSNKCADLTSFGGRPEPSLLFENIPEPLIWTNLHCSLVLANRPWSFTAAHKFHPSYETCKPDMQYSSLCVCCKIVLPPSHETCWRFVKIWIYLDTKLDASEFTQISRMFHGKEGVLAKIHHP